MESAESHRSGARHSVHTRPGRSARSRSTARELRQQDGDRCHPEDSGGGLHTPLAGRDRDDARDPRAREQTLAGVRNLRGLRAAACLLLAVAALAPTGAALPADGPVAMREGYMVNFVHRWYLPLNGKWTLPKGAESDFQTLPHAK